MARGISIENNSRVPVKKRYERGDTQQTFISAKHSRRDESGGCVLRSHVHERILCTDKKIKGIFQSARNARATISRMGAEYQMQSSRN